MSPSQAIFGAVGSQLLLVFVFLLTLVAAAEPKRRAPPRHPDEDQVIMTALHTTCFGLTLGILTAAAMYYWPRWSDSETRRLQRLREKKKAAGAVHKTDCPCCQ